MSRTTRTLLASFIENAAKGCVTPLEWDRFSVTHYGDEKMEAARRHRVRILQKRPVPNKGDLDFLYSIAADLRRKSDRTNGPMPKLGKAHSAQMAEEFVRLGWPLKHEFRADGDDEPYEYVFEWLADGEAVYPGQSLN
jgi:hypothetical protein